MLYVPIELEIVEQVIVEVSKVIERQVTVFVLTDMPTGTVKRSWPPAGIAFMVLKVKVKAPYVEV